ncbi:MAG: phytanoyl-CoA dioxygenase family protein [Pseudomonadota bacterium]
MSSFFGPKSSIGEVIGELGFDTTPVRLVAFNKTDKANWSVPWHQDRVVAVAQKADANGYSNWVAKPGFWHCEAPESLLKEMVFVRIHLDDSTRENGPLELAIGSHRHGRISASDASAIANSCAIESCDAASGDVLIVHALTLHRSSSAAVPTARRTLRVDFAKRIYLSPQLQWAINTSASV